MVTNNKSARSTEGTPGIVDLYPQSMKDLRESKYDKFVVKFYGDFCQPCKKLDAWLHSTYKPKATVPVYHVNVEKVAEGSFEETIAGKFSVMNLPTLVITNKSLEPGTALIGFNEEKVVALLDKHFSGS